MINSLTNMLFAAVGGPAAIDYEVRTAVSAALLIFMAVTAIAVIVIIMMQKGTNDNVGVITGAADTYYGKNKAQTKETRLKIVTYVLFAVLLVTSLVYFIIRIV